VAAGLADAHIVDEAYGRALFMTDPDGFWVAIDGVQTDLHGYHPPWAPRHLAASDSRLDDQAAGVVQAVHKHPQIVLGQILVDGLPAALPVAVVIDDADAAGDKSRP
jgi:hypothetical protein